MLLLSYLPLPVGERTEVRGIIFYGFLNYLANPVDIQQDIPITESYYLNSQIE
jgi:hypothetical protein